MEIKGLSVYTDDDIAELRSDIDILKYNSISSPIKLNKLKRSNLFNELIEISKNYSEDTQFELAKKMYDHEYFNLLNNREATEENLWVTLNLNYFWEYTYKRHLSTGNISEKVIKQRVFKEGKMFYNRNSLARLWWITKLTVEESLEDKFALTKILLCRSQFEQSIMESTISKNEKCLKNILKAIYNYENKYDDVSSKDIISIMKELNKMGGTYVLDIMDYNFFYEIVQKTCKKKS